LASGEFDDLLEQRSAASPLRKAFGAIQRRLGSIGHIFQDIRHHNTLPGQGFDFLQSALSEFGL
jgi:hypothetical protein